MTPCGKEKDMNITEITSTKKQTAERLRLAPYCRVSSDSTDQLHSFAAQIRYYSDYAKKHPEYQLVDIYADEGITGTEMKKRDELNRLIADCRKGKVDRIIVKSVSRLARNTEELLVLLRMCKEIGVSVYFEEQGIDTEKLNMEMIVTSISIVCFIILSLFFVYCCTNFDRRGLTSAVLLLYSVLSHTIKVIFQFICKSIQP